MNCGFLKSQDSEQVAKYVRKLCNKGMLHEAIQSMDSSITNRNSCHVSSTVLYDLLQKCIEKKDLDSGRRVHLIISRNSYELDTFFGCHLIRMYALCGSLTEANKVFLNLSNPNAFAWSAVILAHAKFGEGRDVIALFSKSQELNINPGEHMYLAVLKTCLNSAALHEGKLLHSHVFESGFDMNVTICNTLISMYAACGCLGDARRVFDRMHKANVVTWNAMITGYMKHKFGQEALQLYHRMWLLGVRPDRVTILCSLNACACIPAFYSGKLIYGFMLEEDIAFEVDVVNALIDMYLKCGSLHDGLWVFNQTSSRDLVTFSVMIAGYVQHDHNREAFQLFYHMMKEGVKPDNVAYTSILKASSNLEDIDMGRLLHVYGSAINIEQDAFVGSTLIDMYAKNGKIKDARRVFDGLAKHNVVTWGAMITGYAQQGYGDEVFQLYLQMRQQHIMPNSTLHVNMLMACSNMALLTEGQLIHRSLINGGNEADATAGSALIDMYAKCGSLEDAVVVFYSLPKQSVGTCTALMTGFAQHNDYISVVVLLNRMQREGLVPNGVTFASILSACSHMGLADEGCSYFDSAKETCTSLHTHEHFNCVVDLMGRTGHLNEAEVLLQTLPAQLNLSSWMSLLSHCRLHGDVGLGRRCLNNIMLINEKHAAAYSLMANIYADAGMTEEAMKMLELKASATKQNSCLSLDSYAKGYQTVFKEDSIFR